ncbi:hypothetical protein ScPMuIL_003798 [Solemya velum]
MDTENLSLNSESRCIIDPGRFSLSRTHGFLLENPMVNLSSYFEQWNELSSKMPELVALHKFRQVVDQMPLLDHNKLESYRELRLAHLQLSYIGSGYVWQEGDKGVPKTLPACVAVPWCAVAEILGIKPILSHPSLVLANWKLQDPEKPISVENMVSILQLPGGEEADWFVIATAGVELSFTHVIKPMLDAVEFASCRDVDRLSRALEDMTEGLTKMLGALKRINERLKAETFYNVLRPFLAGWGGEGSPLPEGLIYEGVSEEPKQMMGGSAAQSSLLQSIDAALGIRHEADNRQFMLTMRQYMPQPHRELVDELEKKSCVQTFTTGSRDERVKIAYNNCLSAVMVFRNFHMQIVTKNIIEMSERKDRNKEYKSIESKGTGGSSIMPFLKGLRGTTHQHKVDL